MSFMFLFPDLLYNHIDSKIANKLKGDRRQVFENLLVGTNIFSLEDIKYVAEAVLRIPDNKIRTITLPEFIKILGHDYRDNSGYLV